MNKRTKTWVYTPKKPQVTPVPEAEKVKVLVHSVEFSCTGQPPVTGGSRKTGIEATVKGVAFDHVPSNGAHHSPQITSYF